MSSDDMKRLQFKPIDAELRGGLKPGEFSVSPYVHVRYGPSKIDPFFFHRLSGAPLPKHALPCERASCEICKILTIAKRVQARGGEKVVLDSFGALAHEHVVDERIARYFPIKLVRDVFGGYRSTP